jgi:hypothetical protein
MILGQPVGPQQRVPFNRPDHAGAGYVPRMIKTGFISHLQPFNTLPAMRAGMPHIATAAAQTQMRPGNPRFRQGVAATAPPPPDCTNCPTAPAATAGYFGAPFNIHGRARGHMHVNPYTEMVTSAWQGIRSSGRAIRGGVYGAGALIHRLMPAGFPGAARQAGGYLPFPAAAAPAVLAPAPAATAGFGRCVWQADRSSAWRNRF